MVESDDPEAWMAEGHALIADGRDAEALPLFERAIAALPDSVDAWLGKGNALAGLERYEEAQAATDRALELNPSDARVWNNRGYIYQSQGHLIEALDAFDHALVLDPAYESAWLRKASALWDLDRPEEALVCYDRALAIDPQHGETWRLKGAVLGALERPSEALPYFEQALAFNLNDEVAWHHKGQALHNLEQYEEALACFEHALSLDGEHTDKILLGKGYALGTLERYAEALAAFEGVLQLAPEEASAWYCKGETLRMMERHEEALAAYEQAIVLDSTHTEAWKEKITSLWKLSRAEEALPVAEAFLSQNETDPSAWRYLVAAFNRLERFVEALAVCERALAAGMGNVSLLAAWEATLSSLQRDEALCVKERVLKLSTDDVWTWDAKGWVLRQLGRDEEAAQAFLRARELEPEEFDPAMQYAAALYRLRRYEEAVPAYDYALKLDPENDAMWRFKGESLEHLGRMEEALSCYERSLQSEPKNATVWGYRANALFQLQRYEDAVDTYDEALRLQPEKASFWHGKAAALFRLKRYAEALETCDRAIEADATYSLAWQLIGAIRSRESHYDKALEAFDGALQATKKPKEAITIWLYKSSLLCKMGRYDDARATCDEAERAGGDDAGNGDVARVAEMRRYIDRITSRTVPDQRLRLRDGRWLGYVDYGDPTGQVIICCHGLPGSRLDFANLDEDLLLTLGVRIIAPDRPGMGLSDYQRKRTVLDWPDDVAQLADHLGIERFAVLGASGGGAYAAACAYKLPEQVTKLGLVSSAAPPEKESGIRWVGSHNRRAALLRKVFSWLLMGPAGELAAHVIRIDTADYLRVASKRFPQVDQAALGSDAASPVVLEMTSEVFRQGMRGFTKDQSIMSGLPWGFCLEDIATEAYVWYGEQDTLVLPAAAHYLAQTLPHSHIQAFPNEGHLLWSDHWQEIVTALTRGSEAATPTT